MSASISRIPGCCCCCRWHCCRYCAGSATPRLLLSALAAARPLGRLLGWLWRAFAVLALARAVLALAGPGRSETQVPRTGHGAEILVLMDRSRSMDDHMLPANWRKLDPLNVRAQSDRGPQKAKVARELLSTVRRASGRTTASR